MWLVMTVCRRAVRCWDSGAVTDGPFSSLSAVGCSADDDPGATRLLVHYLHHMGAPFARDVVSPFIALVASGNDPAAADPRRGSTARRASSKRHHQEQPGRLDVATLTAPVPEDSASSTVEAHAARRERELVKLRGLVVAFLRSISASTARWPEPLRLLCLDVRTAAEGLVGQRKDSTGSLGSSGHQSGGGSDSQDEFEPGPGGGGASGDEQAVGMGIGVRCVAQLVLVRWLVPMIATPARFDLNPNSEQRPGTPSQHAVGAGSGGTVDARRRRQATVPESTRQALGVVAKVVAPVALSMRTMCPTVGSGLTPGRTVWGCADGPWRISESTTTTNHTTAIATTTATATATTSAAFPAGVRCFRVWCEALP